MTTADQINALLDQSTKLAEGATAGPWLDTGAKGFIRPESSVEPICQTWDQAEDDYKNADLNRPFIAAARTAIPARDKAVRVAVDLANVARRELAALVTDPDNPDFMPALGNKNPSDALCLEVAYNALIALNDSILAILKEGK